MGDANLLQAFISQIAELKAAVRAILQLDEAFDDVDPAVAEAATAAFQTHAPGFKLNEQKGTLDGRFKVDTALRGVFTELVQAATRERQPVLQHRLAGAPRPSMPQLLDLVRYLAVVQLSDSTLFLHLISDLVEVCAVDEGGPIFGRLEAAAPALRPKLQSEAQGNLAKLGLLRACNLLLRRLSRAHHVHLAGRIHLLLSQLLPAMDRSALNPNGFHNESHAVEVEDVPEGFLGTDGQPVDAAFYRQFWGLQAVFQRPNNAANPNLWLQVHAGIKAALARFAQVRPGAGGSGLAAAGEGLSVQYLASPRLLHLQLRDAGFRRHFLVQCLVLLQACSRRSSGRAQETFRIKQQGEADDLRAALLRKLEGTPPHGGEFAAAIAALLASEDAWADWKADGAKSFKQPERPLQAPPPAAKRRRVGRPDAVNLGTRELTRLWSQTPDNLGAIHRDARRQVPSLREFLAPVVQEMDPEEGIEEQYKRKLDPVYKWEALRAVSKASAAQLVAVVRAKGQDLEEAVWALFPADVPPGAVRPERADLPRGNTNQQPAASPGPLSLAATEDPMDLDSQAVEQPAAAEGAAAAADATPAGEQAASAGEAGRSEPAATAVAGNGADGGAAAAEAGEAAEAAPAAAAAGQAGGGAIAGAEAATKAVSASAPQAGESAAAAENGGAGAEPARAAAEQPAAAPRAAAAAGDAA